MPSRWRPGSSFLGCSFEQGVSEILISSLVHCVLDADIRIRYNRYFSNFIDKLSETSTDPWTEVEWILFGLAEGPRDPAWNFEIFKAAKGSCDTSTWKM